MKKLFHKLANRVAHDRELLFPKMRTDRQTQDFLGEGLGDGEIRPRMVSRLHGIRPRAVRWNRIVDQGRDPSFGEMLLQGVPFPVPDDKQMPDRIGPIRNARQDE